MHHHAARPAVLAAACLAMFALTGCGAESEAEAADGPDAADCAVTSVEVVVGDQDSVSLSQGGALEISAEEAYTLYAADFEPRIDGINSGAMPEDGTGHQAVVSITTFDPGEETPRVIAGERIEYSREAGALTFTAAVFDGMVAYGDTRSAGGSVEVRELGDDAICVDIDYSDDAVSIVGTVSAELGRLDS